MAFLYDNLTAVVVGTTVLLILASLQLRAMELSTAASGQEAALTQSEEIATWMEEDLESMGRHIMTTDTVFGGLSRTKNEVSPTDSVLTGLSFQYKENAGGAAQTVQYDVSAVKTDRVEGKDRTLYQLSRTKGGVSAGRTPEMLGYIDVQFLDRTAAAISAPRANTDQIEALRVHFSVISPYRNSKSGVKEVHRMVAFPYTPAQN
ncbi:hypothetical protein [Salinibacter ruber]|uniref:hypothetical protein n=1 Tax=Salinibacter ruber TaxID=146919 RepID=UPI0021689FD1|nr:hypothetical protein [Salinibacter ruber]MCS3696823.1 hypothetical protein [Salinibacter ruber]